MMEMHRGTTRRFTIRSLGVQCGYGARLSTFHSQLASRHPSLSVITTLHLSIISTSLTPPPLDHLFSSTHSTPHPLSQPCQQRNPPSPVLLAFNHDKRPIDFCVAKVRDSGACTKSGRIYILSYPYSPYLFSRKSGSTRQGQQQYQHQQTTSLFLLTEHSAIIQHRLQAIVALPEPARVSQSNSLDRPGIKIGTVHDGLALNKHAFPSVPGA